jgi:hypothetical protein
MHPVKGEVFVQLVVVVGGTRVLAVGAALVAAVW